MTSLRRFLSAVVASSLVIVGLAAVPAYAAAGPNAPSGLRATALADGTVHFEWNAAVGASAYKLEWSVDEGFPTGAGTTVVNTYSLDHITRTQPTAADATDIHWRVSAYGTGVDAKTLGEPSVNSLVTSNGAAAPVPIGPGTQYGIETIEYPSPTVFSWEPVPGAVAYQLEYSKDNLNGGAVTTKTVSGTQIAPDSPLERVDAGGNPLTWQWRVRALHYNGTTSGTSPSATYGPWSPQREFQITWNVAPSDLYPVDEPVIVTDHSDLAFSWTAVQGAAKYRVSFGLTQEDSSGSPRISDPINVHDVFTTTYIPTVPVPDDVWFWQVTPLDHAGNLGTPSTINQFRKEWGAQASATRPTDNGRTSPIPITDSGSAMYLSDFELEWEPMPRATLYEVEVQDGEAHVWKCTTPSTSATIITGWLNGGYNSGNAEVLKGPGTCLAKSTPGNLEITSGKTYSWQVRAYDLTGSITGGVNASSPRSDDSEVRFFSIVNDDRPAPQEVNVDLDLDAFEVDNPEEVKGQPAPVLTWERSGRTIDGQWYAAPGYEVTLYKNPNQAEPIGSYRTPSTKLRINGVLNDNTTGSPYYASVRPIVPTPSWTSSSIQYLGGTYNHSAESFVWQKAGQLLVGLATQTMDDGSVRLSWTPQSVTGKFDGGNRGYRVRIYDGEVVQGTAKKIEFPFFMAQQPAASNDSQFPSTSTDVPLPTGSNYSFDVAPLDANGNPGRATRSAKFSIGIATPVVTEEAEVTGGTAAISWSTVPGALKYSVEYRHASMVKTLSNVTQTGAVLTDLSEGAYQWRVRAHNASNKANNNGSWSDWFSFDVGKGAVTLADAGALPLNNRVVKWSSTVNGAVRYQVQLADNPQITNNVKSYETVGKSFSFPDAMSSGKQYYWRVRALAEPVGSSSALRVLATSQADAFTVRTAPEVVGKPTLAVDGTGLKASWTQLTGTKAGTDQPISYIVAYREKTTSDNWSGAKVVNTTANAISYSVSGLKKGVTYQFRVAAKNSEGTGPWSAIVEKATANIPKAAPSLVATPKLTEMTLKIGSVKAADNGGSVITGYQLKYKLSTTSTWTTKKIPVGSSYNITGLKKLSTYQISVAAINAVGVGPATVVSKKTLGLSTAPRSAKVARADKSAKVTWTTPATPNGKVTGYVIQKRLGTSGTWVSAGTASASAKSYTVKSLANGKKYQVRVAAKTSVGTGTYSSALSVTPAGKPAKPAKPKASSSSKGVVTVSWGKAAANGAAISSYTVQYSTNGSKWQTLAKTKATTYKVTSTKGTRGKKVYFRLVATNAMGSSSASTAVSVVRK